MDDEEQFDSRPSFEAHWAAMQASVAVEEEPAAPAVAEPAAVAVVPVETMPGMLDEIESMFGKVDGLGDISSPRGARPKVLMQGCIAKFLLTLNPALASRLITLGLDTLEELRGLDHAKLSPGLLTGGQLRRLLVALEAYPA